MLQFPYYLKRDKSIKIGIEMLEANLSLSALDSVQTVNETRLLPAGM